MSPSTGTPTAGTNVGGNAGMSSAGTHAGGSAGMNGAGTNPGGSTGMNAAGTNVSGTAGMNNAGTHAGGGAGMNSAGASASAGSTGSDGAIPATFETVKLVLGGGGGIMPCSAAPCHGVNGVAPPDHPLELPPTDDAQLYANLTSYVSKACSGQRLVAPGNPAQSALITILRGPCGMTPRMPYGCSAEAGDCIPDDYIAAVAQWITNGAPRP